VIGLLNRTQDAGEHGMRLGTAFGSVAAADLASDDGWAQRVLGAPVGGVDRIGFEEKRKHGREFNSKMRAKRRATCVAPGRSISTLSWFCR
jgi:hypothetical protein